MSQTFGNDCHPVFIPLWAAKAVINRCARSAQFGVLSRTCALATLSPERVRIEVCLRRAGSAPYIPALRIDGY